MHTNLRTVKTATVALRRNVMRSLLTCLGIIIGVAAVIAMMEIGHGSSTSISKTLATMGANMLMVFPGNAAAAGVSMGTGSSMSLTPQDCQAIMDECPAVRDVAPIVRARSSQAIYGGRNWIPATIQGTTPSILEIQNWGDVTAGEMFTDQDVRNANEVCVIGTTIVRQLFETDNPIGKFMRLSNVTFRVVGVLKTKGANMWGSDQDDIVMAPWTTIKYRVSGQSIGGAAQSTVAAASAKHVDQLDLSQHGAGFVSNGVQHPTTGHPPTGAFHECRSDHLHGPERQIHSRGHDADHRGAARSSPHSSR